MTAAALATVGERMLAAVAGGADAQELYGWLRYHLGWLDEHGQPSRRRAKGARGRLCLQCCEAVGGDPAAAVSAAVAIELTHEFSLVHDDIEDGDTTRRGRPALWVRVGIPQAINAGDALFSLARRELLRADCPPATILRMSQRYDAACIALAEGQYLDLAFEARADVSTDAYLGMVRRKTGALLGAAAALGADTGGATPEQAAAFAAFGEEVGIAFQMADDLLGLWGDPAETGKPAGNDLLRRKKTLPVLMALASDDLAAEVRHALATPLDIPAASRLAGRLAQAGIRDAVAAAASERSAAALTAIERLSLRDAPRQALADFAALAVHRRS